MPPRNPRATEQQAQQEAASAVVAQPAPGTNAVQQVRQLLEVRGDELAASLRTFGITPERFMSVALSQFSRKPELWACEPLSVYRAMKECADAGLEPTGAIGGAHLVAYGNQCTVLYDYRGLLMLVRRSGEVKRAEARVVRTKDQFSVEYGLEPRLVHVPALSEADPGPLAFVYAVAVFTNGDRQFDVMSAAEVEAIRQRSRAKNSGPWVSDPFEMAKKTVLRRLCKLLPLTAEARAAIAREDEAEGDRGPERAGQVLGRQAQLRQAIAGQLGALEATSEPEHQQLQQSVGQPTAEPTPQAVQAEQVQAQQPAGVEVPESVDAVDEPPAEPAPRPQAPAASTRARPGCGATVGGPGGEQYTCTLAPGHRGEHTDGQHDWPAG